MPSFQNEEAQIDVSFFQENNPKAVASDLFSTNNFSAAKNTVLAFSGSFATSLYEGFLQPVNGQEASFDDGVWEWTYNYEYEGTSVEIRTTAEEVGENIKWAMYWSFDDTQGNSYENYKVFEGTVSKDGSQGSWTFNILDPEGTDEVPGLEYSWEVISETEVNLTAKLFDESGNTAATITYEENKPDHTLNINGSSDSSTESAIVYWNTETNEGYIEQNGSRCSWDSNFQDTSCVQ